MLQTLRFFRDQHELELQATDWQALARLPRPRLAKDVQDIFFPKWEEEYEADVSRLRVKGFLEDYDDEGYDKVYQLVISHPDLAFPDVHTVLKTNQKEGRVMRTIMAHVGQWLNREPFRVTDRASEKPLLRKDLLPALRERFPDTADAQSLELQQRILHYVQTHVADLTQTVVVAFLEVYPANAAETYRERFHHQVWHDLLRLVYDFCGPHFQADAMLPFNLQPPLRKETVTTSTIVNNLCQFLPQLPEVMQNPALQGRDATQALCNTLQIPILQWAIQQCEAYLAPGGNSSSSSSSSELVQEQLAHYRAHMPENQAPASTVEFVRSIPDSVELPSPVASVQACPDLTYEAAMALPTLDESSDRIQPRLVSRKPTTKVSKGGCEQPLPQLPAPKTVVPAKDHLDAHHKLEEMLRLPGKPRKSKLGRGGQGWRTRAGVRIRSEWGTFT